MKLNTIRIRQELERLNWTPYKLSKEMKMANQTVYNILNSDGKNFTLKTVDRFADVLGIDAKDLLK